MKFAGLLAVSAAAIRGAAAAVCSNNLLIDNFSQFSSNTNSLGSWTSDDGTMTSIAAANNVLSITPKNNGYFYESFDCQAASNNGYSGITFSVKGPAGGSFTLELQSQTSCTATSYKSTYYTVSGLTGNTQVITVPWTSFGAGSNANAVVAISWSAFSTNAAGWQLSNINFACKASNPSVAASVAPSVAASVAPSVAASSARAASSVAGSSAAPAFSAVSSKAQVASSAAAASSIVRSSSRAVLSPFRSYSSQISSVAPSKAASSSNIASSAVASSAAASSVRAVSSTLSTIASSAQPASSGCSSNLVVEDFTSQSRLTFLFYNALGNPTSDDGTLKSVVVDQVQNRCTFTNSGTNNYWYTQLNCMDVRKYGGASMRIKAAAGTTFQVQIEYVKTCGGTPINLSLTTAQLGWTFNGNEQLYSFPFSKYTGLDQTKVNTIIFNAISKPITMGPISLYCGSTVSEYVVPSQSAVVAPTDTVAAPAGTGAALVIDKFANKDSNALGSWHGYDDGMTVTYGTGSVKIVSNDPDYAYYTQFVNGCFDARGLDGNYLHIKYSGSTAFSIALQQHNTACNADIQPYPQTWDEVEAGRYASNGDIYVPMSHFNINKQYAIGFALKSWYTTAATTFTLVEIVKSIPAGWTVESKLPTGNLVFACTRPNSFAFCIDDGDPALAQQVMQIVKSSNIKVTFFTVGAPLLDSSNNLSAVYRDMQAQGHQIALHSYTHPKMEGLPNYNAIDWEYNNDIAAVGQVFNGFTSKYFRPPFGTEGARMRYRWTQAAGTNDAQIVNWSVDIQDWVWAQTSTPEKQLTAFKSDVDKGGNLVVAHYLYPQTVQYFQQFIDYAKGTGKQLMRLDQCMMDPNAPPL